VPTELRLHDLLHRRVLVTRESARSLEAFLSSSLDLALPEIRIDFAGVEGVTPSFIDELLGVLKGATASASANGRRFVFANLPTRMSEKFAAIARGRNLTLRVGGDESWTFGARGAGRSGAGS